MDDDESKIAEKYEALRDVMDEQMRRLWAATEARALGYGGVTTVARAVGLTRPTITAGMKNWVTRGSWYRWRRNIGCDVPVPAAREWST